MLISAHSLTHSFAGKTLFTNLKLGLFPQQKVGLMGPNGVGKSTLFKILAKKLVSDQGEVVWQKGLKIGFLEQTPLFNQGATILETILEHTLDKESELGEAYALLNQFDLHKFGENFRLEKLSGGWQKRVALARELILKPDLLFMDEPTNHLDVSGIIWLEEFIADASMGIFMITHDQLFLERTCEKFIDLDPKNPDFILVHEGDFASYLENKNILLAGQLQKEKSLANTLRRETEWLRRGAIARQTKQKGRIQRASELKGEVEQLEQKNKISALEFDFSTQGKSPKKLIEAKQISKKFGDSVLFKDLDLTIHQKTRLALLGDNGCGKSTLIRMLAGYEQPTTGSVQITDGIKMNFFEQNRDSLKRELSLFKNICPDGDYVFFQGRYIHAQSYLDQFLFTRAQSDLPVSRLSGGEQARLRLAQLMLTEAQVLFLDEPTNDLDRASLLVLQESLKNFGGAVVLVTHDRYFMDQVADQILAFPQMTIFSEYYQWESWYQQNNDSLKKEGSPSLNSTKDRQTLGVGSGPTKLTFKEKKDLESMEEKILQAEESLQLLQNEIQDPAITSQPLLLQDKCLKISALEKEIQEMYDRWAELENKNKIFENSKKK